MGSENSEAGRYDSTGSGEALNAVVPVTRVRLSFTGESHLGRADGGHANRCRNREWCNALGVDLIDKSMPVS